MSVCVMEDTFAALTDLLADTDYVDETIALERKIADIKPPEPAPVDPAPAREPLFDASRNLLEPAPMRRFVDNIFTPTKNFTPIISTTNTMEGLLSNVQFHEEELVKRVTPDHNIVMYHCNYGQQVYPGFAPKTKVKKKTGVPRRPRRVQGSGSAFNSQLTAVVRSTNSVVGPDSMIALPAEISRLRKGRASLAADGRIIPAESAPIPEWLARIDDGDDPMAYVPAIVDGHLLTELEPDDAYIVHVPSSTQVYKFKIFRTGRIQLPGVRPDIIDDVMACVQILVTQLNAVLHPNVTDPTKLVRLVYIMPVMKNYKFITLPRIVEEEVENDDGELVIERNEYSLINLNLLRQLLEKYRAFVTPAIDDYGAELPLPEPDWDIPPPAAPAMFDIKYTREDTKLSVKFSTPIPKKQKKKTRVNIFMSGKVNILGAFDDDATDKIVQYLDWVFQTNPELFVQTYVIKPWTLPRIANIIPLTADEEAKIAFDQDHRILSTLPELSAGDVESVLSWASSLV